MESIKTTVNHITAARYTYADSPEAGSILHDLQSGCVCLVTNGDPVWYDSMDDLNADISEDAENYIIAATFATITDYIAYYYDDDLMAYADDDTIIDVLYNTFGYGAAAWIKDIAANA